VIIDPLKVKRNYALFIPKSDSDFSWAMRVKTM
jgi:hypothetical protein